MPEPLLSGNPTVSETEGKETHSSSAADSNEMLKLDAEQLSPHFTLHELTRSQRASRMGFKEQFTPPPDVVENLRFLCKNLLEKLRELNNGKALTISSGYRCTRVNEAVGSKPTSQHLSGEAADIDFGSREANKAFFDKIRNSNIEFDQLLNEFDYDWIHISLKKGTNRKQVLDITRK